MRTGEERAAEIQALRDLRDRVPTHSLLHDDNRHLIDVQILVIRECLGTVEAIRRWGGAGEVGAACGAAAWLHGDAEAPSADWSTLV